MPKRKAEKKEKTHPGTALNPTVPLPGFVPFTISFSIPGFAYKLGFKNPTAPFAAFNLSSLIRVTTLAKIGVEADVPPLSV
jgi:hypothetical protein